MVCVVVIKVIYCLAEYALEAQHKLLWKLEVNRKVVAPGLWELETCVDAIYKAVQPPSTLIVVPVICAAASDAKNTAVPPSC